MEEIRFQQINAPRPMTGKSFLLGVAAVLLRLAIAQILCNLLITATGVGLLNIAFYLYAVATLFRFMQQNGRRKCLYAQGKVAGLAKTSGRQHDKRDGDTAG